jgi:hypothetical protein
VGEAENTEAREAGERAEQEVPRQRRARFVGRRQEIGVAARETLRLKGGRANPEL